MKKIMMLLLSLTAMVWFSACGQGGSESLVEETPFTAVEMNFYVESNSTSEYFLANYVDESEVDEYAFEEGEDNATVEADTISFAEVNATLTETSLNSDLAAASTRSSHANKIFLCSATKHAKTKTYTCTFKVKTKGGAWHKRKCHIHVQKPQDDAATELVSVSVPESIEEGSELNVTAIFTDTDGMQFVTASLYDDNCSILDTQSFYPDANTSKVDVNASFQGLKAGDYNLTLSAEGVDGSVYGGESANSTLEKSFCVTVTPLVASSSSSEESSSSSSSSSSVSSDASSSSSSSSSSESSSSQESSSSSSLSPQQQCEEIDKGVWYNGVCVY